MEDQKESFPKKYMTVKALADYLDTSRQQIYDMIRERKIPFSYVPGTRMIRFSRIEIEKWIDSAMIKPVP